MLQRFDNFISKNSLFNKEEPVLLAISGGADSVCLFYLLLNAGYHFSVAHCNFQLRGKESEADEAFVVALARAHQIEIFTERFDTSNESEKRKKGIQEVARELRYNWFKELLTKRQFSRILTAHHQTDNLETMLINILRGTGIKGLHGIPLNENNIVRPLLFANREEILSYLQQNQHAYREDSSNASDNYLRNQIRHNILPALKQIQPEVETRFYETAQKVKGFELLSNELISNLWKSICIEMDGNLKIDLVLLDNLENQPLFLFHNLQAFGFTMLQIEDLLNSNQIGKKVIANQYELIKERLHLQLQRVEFTGKTISVQIEAINQTVKIMGQIAEIHIYNNNFQPNYTLKDTLFINADKLTFPLTLRMWEDGDKIRPLGMNGYKKVSDILTDKKVENSKRNTYIVLQQYEKELIALFPLVVSEDYKINASTQSILSITLNMA
jgi:tRNA(Ile)-lysidine synthase